jgi:hypothetical protein
MIKNIPKPEIKEFHTNLEVSWYIKVGNFSSCEFNYKEEGYWEVEVLLKKKKIDSYWKTMLILIIWMDKAIPSDPSYDGYNPFPPKHPIKFFFTESLLAEICLN